MVFLLESDYITDSMKNQLIFFPFYDDNMVTRHQFEYECLGLVLNRGHLESQRVENRPELILKLSSRFPPSKAVVILTIRDSG